MTTPKDLEERELIKTLSEPAEKYLERKNRRKDLNTIRDELAKKYWDEDHVATHEEILKEYSDPVHFEECSAFKQGFDSAREILEKEIESLKGLVRSLEATLRRRDEKLDIAEEALEEGVHETVTMSSMIDHLSGDPHIEWSATKNLREALKRIKDD